MKRVFFDEDIFKLLKEIDHRYNNADIGITVFKEEIPVEILTQLYSNGWNIKNNYFLVLDDINAATIKTLLNIIQFPNFFKGVCINCEVETDILQKIIDACRASNLNIFHTKRYLKQDQLFFPYLKVVDILYDI